MTSKWFLASLMGATLSGFAVITAIAAPPSNSPNSPVLQTTTTSTPTLTLTPSVTSTITATVTTTATLSPGNEKIAKAISDYFRVGLDEVMEIQSQAHGWGEVFFVFALAQMSGDSPDEIWALREDGQGWGQIVMGLGFRPGNKGNNLGAAVSGRSTPTPASTGSSSNQSPKPTDEDKNCKGNAANKGKGNPCNIVAATPVPTSNPGSNRSGNGSGNGNGNGNGNGRGEGKPPK